MCIVYIRVYLMKNTVNKNIFVLNWRLKSSAAGWDILDILTDQNQFQIVGGAGDINQRDNSLICENNVDFIQLLSDS